MQPTIAIVTSSLAATLKMKCDCRRAVELLAAKGVPFQQIDAACDDGWQELIQLCDDGNIVFPQIFVNGKYIGTLDSVQELEDDGGLDIVLGIF